MSRSPTKTARARADQEIPLVKSSNFARTVLALTAFTAVLALISPAPAAASNAKAPRRIETNAAVFTNAPAWVTERRATKVIRKVERFLEWDIRRVTVHWHLDQAEFEKLHGFGPSVLAFARPVNNTVHIGPRVDTKNFDGVFGHELGHVIIYQKYKDAVPKWLEEGLANAAARRRSLDYDWLARNIDRLPKDVRTLHHPFRDAINDSSMSYAVSTALVEMLARKCNLHDLLQLSMRRKLETYIGTFCEMPDINQALRDWIRSKSKE